MWRCACALALLCAALTRCNGIKRAEMSTVPFVLGSRYGRSPPRMIAPRNDRWGNYSNESQSQFRFFMGSRYGKRSGTPLHMTLRSLQNVPETTWRDISSICDLAAFSPLCSRLPVAMKALYRPDLGAIRERMAYQN